MKVEKSSAPLNPYQNQKLIDVSKALQKYFRKEDLRELRVLNTDSGTQSGYYNSIDNMLREAVLLDGQYNLYMTYNTVKPELKERSPERLSRYVKQTTSDADILRINYLLIDLDPDRPAGVSATNREKEQAKILAEKVKAYLDEQGFPEPIFADSGNGYHLMLPVSLENTTENVNLLKKFLESLHLMFSSNGAAVDVTTSNPSRITKLYGTIACKGEHTDERPHRCSKILSGPEEIKPATYDQLKAIADKLPDEVVNIPRFEGKKLDIMELIKEYNLDLAYEKAYKNKHRIFVLRTCPWNPEHTNASSYIIQFDNGAVAAGCHHNGCSDENWQTLKELLGENFASNNSSQITSMANQEQPKKLVDRGIELIKDFEFYHNENNDEYVKIDLNGMTQDVLVEDKLFKQIFQKLYFDAEKTMPSSEVVNQAIAFGKMRGNLTGEEKKLVRRIASIKENEFFYDLCNSKGEVLKITKYGCEICRESPIVFKKSKNSAAQVMPDFKSKGIDLIDLLKKHFRLKSEDDYILLAVFLISCLIYGIPHIIMILYGEKGSTKSTSMRMIKKMIDPERQPVLAMPTATHDLVVCLTNRYMSCFDNMEHLSWEKSNILCMSSTGGGLALRKLYTDDDEILTDVKRCVVLNGINIVATKPDLLDRSIILEFSRICSTARLQESTVWKNFDNDLPQILGSMFNAMSEAIAIHENLVLGEADRMVDFCYWGYAIAEAIGIGGRLFLRAYQNNQKMVNSEALSANPVATAIIALMSDQYELKSSVSSLYKQLEETAQKEQVNIYQNIWPKDANVLTKRLKEVNRNLEEVKIFYEIRNAGNYKEIRIVNEANKENGKITKLEHQKKSEANQVVQTEESLNQASQNQPTDVEALLND